jgi:PAS domain S-box-containing protein
MAESNGSVPPGLASGQTAGAEEERQRLEALNSRILTSAPIGILAYDTAGRITLINDTFLRIGGIPPERRAALIGVPIEGVWTAQANRVEPFVARVMAGESFSRTYEAFRVRNGETKSVVAHVGPVTAPDGRIEGGVLLLEDVSELNAALAAARSSEALYREIGENLPGLVCQFHRSAQGEYSWTFMSDSLPDLSGRPSSDFVSGRAVFDGVPPEDLPALLASVEASAASLTTWQRELRLRNVVDGSEHWMWGSAIPHREPDGATVWNGVLLDVTDRHRAEDALRASERRFRSVFESAAVGVALAGVDGSIIDANRALADMLGYTRDELCRLSAAQITHPDDTSIERGLFRELREQPEGFLHLEKRYVRKDGSIIWGRLSLSAIRDDLGQPTTVLALVEDVTDRVHLVEELTRSYGALKNVLDHLTVGVCIAVFNRFEYANPALCRMLGYTDAELRRLDPESLVQDWDASRLREVVDRLDAGRAEEVRALARLRRKDGTSFDARVTGVAMRHHGDLADLFLVEDLTREQDQQAQLAQAQVLHTIGLLAGGIAHDFNNLLTGFAAHASLLRGQVQRLGLDAHDVDGLERLIQRAAALTQKLLAFGRRQILRAVPLDAGRLVAEFVPVARRLLGERIRIETRLTGEPLVVMADPIQLEQVLLNLAVNARDAMQGGGTLTFETELEPAAASLDQPGFAVLVVRDTGRGIAPAHLGRVFEPFFTTKPTGAGTGLGLAVVHGIVEQHDGTIDVASRLGEGTEFRVRLPLTTKAPVAPDRRSDPPVAPAPIGLRVLVAEDDDDLRHLVERVLNRAGYRVIPARDGGEAVEAFLREPDIALVLLDMVMPDLTGLEALDQIRKVDPTVPAVLVSGYSDDLVDGEGGRRDDLLFVPKPFSPAEILAAVARALEKGKGAA